MTAGQTRQNVIQLSQLDLDFSLPRMGPPGENIEDDLRAIDDFHVSDGRNGTHLGGGQALVEDQKACPLLEPLDDHFLELSASEKEFRMWVCRSLDDRIQDRPRRRTDQFSQFLKPFFLNGTLLGPGRANMSWTRFSAAFFCCSRSSCCWRHSRMAVIADSKVI